MKQKTHHCPMRCHNDCRFGRSGRDGGLPDAPDAANRQHVRGRSAGGRTDRARVGQVPDEAKVLYPGKTVAKDPTACNAAESTTAAYMYLQVEIPRASVRTYTIAETAKADGSDETNQEPTSGAGVLTMAANRTRSICQFSAQRRLEPAGRN